MRASGQAVVSLARSVSMAEPFCHVRVMNPLPAELADELLAWLDRAAPWTRRVASSFDRFECDLCRCGLPASLADLLAPATLRAIRADMERLFHVQLGEVYSVVAHRLVGGQGIGINTGEPAGGRETHRLIIQLGGLPPGDCGGQFLLLSAANMEHLHAAFRPIHNTAIGLELSSRSYHAVADLRAGMRYTLAYSFWRADLAEIAGVPGIHPGHAGAASASSAALAPHARRGHDLEVLLDLLAPAQRNAHSQGALLAHLVHTYEILRRWESPAHVCLGGLFRGVYGSETIPAATMALQAREQVGRAIGEQAENLAWLFGALTRSSLVHAWAAHRPGGKATRYCLHLRGEPGALLEVDAGVLAELACIDAASTVEQAARLARNGPADTSRAEHAMLLMPPGSRWRRLAAWPRWRRTTCFTGFSHEGGHDIEDYLPSGARENLQTAQEKATGPRFAPGTDADRAGREGAQGRGAGKGCREGAGRGQGRGQGKGVRGGRCGEGGQGGGTGRDW